MSKKIVKLTESQLREIVSKVINERAVVMPLSEKKSKTNT